MPEARFTIRFRRARQPDCLAVVLEDETGAPYLLSRRGHRFRLKPVRHQPDSGPTLPARGWQRVPAVSPYSLTELRALLA